MRIAVGLLACLASSALTPALADPQIEAQAAPAASTAPSAPAPANSAATPAPDAAVATQTAAARAQIDRDTQHFLAEGYKPEMHGGEQIYCRKETALGSRLAPVKNCGTLEQLKLNERLTTNGLRDTQRKQVGISNR